MKHALFTVVAGLAAVFCLAGCTTKSIVTEYDTAGNITKKTETDRDPFDKITESTREKSVVAWSNGWAAYIRATTATTENPTPTGEIYAGKVSKGILSMHKDQQNADKIPAIIAATREDVTVDMTGIKATGNSNTETGSK